MWWDVPKKTLAVWGQVFRFLVSFFFSEAQEEAKEGMEDGPRVRCFPAELAVFSR